MPQLERGWISYHIISYIVLPESRIRKAAPMMRDSGHKSQQQKHKEVIVYIGVL